MFDSTFHHIFQLIKTLFCLCLVLAGQQASGQLLLPAVIADSSLTASDSAYSYKSVRGIEQAEQCRGHALLHAIDYGLLLPRKTFDLLLTSAGFSAVLIDEKKIIRKFEDIFYIYDKKLGWYPVVNYLTGFSKGYGLSLFYNDGYFSSKIKTAYSNRNNWRTKLETSYTFFLHNYLWKTALSLRARRDDDNRFYGIGPDPQSDSRSPFQGNTDQEFGVFYQRRIEAEFSLGFRASPDWELFFSTTFRQRRISDPGRDNSQDIAAVFDISKLAGFARNNRKIYNELSLRFDNRENLRQAQPGIRNETYAATSVGLGGDRSRFFQGGTDLTVFLPVIFDRRLLITRSVFDLLVNLNDRQDIAFVDYPQHPAFRGISSRAFLRSDQVSWLNSLEYQWPLTYHLRSHVFADYMLVAEDASSFQFRGAPWAIGWGMDVHNPYTELARFYLSYGSEGFFARVSVGFSSRYKDRSDWR